MRVAIVGSYPLDSTQIRGGVQAAFAYLVKGLCQIDDLEVHVLTLGNPDQVGRDQFEQDGATIHLIAPFPRFEFARNYRTYQSRLNHKLAHIQPDVIHAQDAASDAYVALRSGYPSVLTVHGVWREDSKYISSLLQRMRYLLHSLLIERYNLKHTRHLIAISRYVTDYFSTLLKPETQIYYIPNAIDENFFDLTNTSDGQTILFAGRVTPRKRVLDLVQAFAKVANQNPLAQLRIAGEYDSDQAYVESIRSFIQNANLGSRISLLGALSEDAVLYEFAGCDILALPSSQETTPMVIAQAMAASKPVVATPVGGVTEMVSNRETGFLVDVGDVEELANALQCLLQDTSLRVRMGQSSYKFAMENYRASVVAKRTYDVYQKIANVRK